jgi:hypothetical protein
MTHYANARNAQRALVNMVYQYFPSANPLFVERVAKAYFRNLTPVQRRKHINGARLYNIMVRNANNMARTAGLLVHLR